MQWSVIKENGHVDTMWETEGRANWENRTDVCTPLCVKHGQWGPAGAQGCSLVLCDDLEGGEGGTRRSVYTYTYS